MTPLGFGLGMESQEDEPSNISQLARDATETLAGQIVGGALTPTVIAQIRDDGTSPQEEVEAFRRPGGPRDAPPPAPPPADVSETESEPALPSGATGSGYQAQCG